MALSYRLVLIPLAAAAAHFGAGISVAHAAPPGLAPECQRAFDRLQRCKREAEAAGVATPARRERTAIYEQRLTAWWSASGAAAAPSCKAIADDPSPCVDRASAKPPTPEEEAEEAQEFKDTMKRFDDLGVPKAKGAR